MALGAVAQGKSCLDSQHPNIFSLIKQDSFILTAHCHYPWPVLSCAHQFGQK